MANRGDTSDAPVTTQAAPQQGRSLLEDSGFLDKARSLRDSAGTLMHKGLQAGKEAFTDAKNSHVAGQVVDQGKQVINSPTTKRITGEVVREGVGVYNDKKHEVNATIDAGKRGDLQGAVRHGAPLLTDVALGPEKLALKIAKDKAFEMLIANAPPEKRGELIRAKTAFDQTERILNPNIAGMVEGQLKRQATEQAVQAAQDPKTRQQAVDAAKSGASKAGEFFHGLGQKFHIVQPREQAEQQQQRR